MSLFSIGDKIVFKENYVLAGKTIEPFSCMYSCIQLSRSPKFYRLYIQNPVRMPAYHHAIPHKAELFQGLNIYTDCHFQTESATVLWHVIRKKFPYPVGDVENVKYALQPYCHQMQICSVLTLTGARNSA